MKQSPYLTIGATMWCIEKGVVIVGYDLITVTIAERAARSRIADADGWRHNDAVS